MTTKTEHKAIGDVLKHKPFYPDLDRQPKDEIVDVEVVLYDWRIVKDWETEDYGQSPFAIVAYGAVDSEKATHTTILSGVVVLKKLIELSRKGYKGVTATLIKEENKSGNPMWNFK